MDSKRLIDRFLFISLFAVFGIKPALSQDAANSMISIQGNFSEKINLSDYTDTSKIDLIVLDAPFYQIELAKELETTNVLDTFDALSPTTYHLFVALSEKYSVFGDYQPAYRNVFFEMMYDKISYNSIEKLDYSLESDHVSSNVTILKELKSKLTYLQYDFIYYGFLKSSKGKNYWMYSEYAKSRNILFLSPNNGNDHFGEEFYHLPVKCDYVILLKRETQRKNLKLICKEFELKRRTLKKNDYSIKLKEGNLKIVFID